MATTDEPIRYYKGRPIWWHISVSQIPRPDWIPKKKEWQAGWIRDVNETTAAITIMNEVRQLEAYVVPLGQIRPREIT